MDRTTNTTAIGRLALAVAALASFLGLATASASAVTWHNTGSTAFTATAGPGTLTVGANNLVCQGSRAAGTATTISSGDVYTANGTAFSTPCSLVGQQTYVQCTIYGFTAVSFSAGVTAGTTNGTCFVKLTAANVGLCTLSGSVPGTYTNPSGITPGRITGLAASTVTVSNYGSTSCPLGTGTGTVTERTGTIFTGSPTSLGPILTRTP